MLGAKIKNIFKSSGFLLISCLVIFCLSIFLRSLIDIGADTAVYLDLGKKVAEGKKYYFDFFESNFPISFYFYALQYFLSSALHINPIFLSEIVINLLALLTILWSAKILRASTIYENKAHYNLILISYFLGFFLRPNALQIGEFGTKTSLLLIALYPYISYSFVRKTALTKKAEIFRGILMGVIPCIKPHYLILLIPIEIYRFWQKKSLRFFFELEKLVMILVGATYLFLMLKFTPEYFEFITPMWSKTYHAYDDSHIFIKNSLQHAAKIISFSFIFLIFSRIKADANDKVLALFFLAATALMILENSGTIDQLVVFYAIATICFLKFSAEFFASKKIILSENKFIIATLILLPLFEMGVLPFAFFAVGGVINIWWFVALIYPILLRKKIAFTAPGIALCLLIYFLSLSFVILTLKYLGAWAHVASNLSLLFIYLFLFEKKFQQKISEKFSPFSIFVIFLSISCLLYTYLISIVGVFSRDSSYTFPNKLSDMVTYYSKEYAPQKEDRFLMISIWIAHQFPALNYLEKDNKEKFHIAAIQADQGVVGSRLMFPIKDSDRVFAYSYLFDDVKDALKDPSTKVILFNNSADVLNKEDRCLITSLEYYFLDPQFKKIFLENFHFVNHVLINRQVQPLKKVAFITREKPSVFDEVRPSIWRVEHDFEIYARNSPVPITH